MTLVINDFKPLYIKKESVITIGKFDSIHLGHQKLLKAAVKKSKEKDMVSIAIVLKKTSKTIYTFEENISFIKNIGINYIIVIDFSKEFYKMDANEFFYRLIEYYRVKHIVVGLDFKFGKDRLGDTSILRKYAREANIKVSVLRFCTYKNVKISTSSIREYLSSGDVETASKMLGRVYSISGIIVHGKALGRKIGYPTANLKIEEDVVVPRAGVYNSIVNIGGGNVRYKAITFVGISNLNNVLRVESHILDFSKMIYGEKIDVKLLKYVRDNIKVDSIDNLKVLLQKDENKARNYFKRRKECLSQRTKKQK